MKTPLYFLLLICVLICYAANAVDVTSVKSMSKNPFSALNDTGNSMEKSKAQSSSQRPHIRDHNNKDKTDLHLVSIDCQKYKSTNDQNLEESLEKMKQKLCSVFRIKQFHSFAGKKKTVQPKEYENLLKTQLRNKDPIKHFVTEDSQPGSQVKTLHKNDIHSLRQLVNEFPNHVIEIQMEMKDFPPPIPLSNIRSISNQLKKPLVKLVRGKDRPELYTDSSLSMVTTAYQPMTDLYERPVYMKDLLEVMQAFENKFTSTSHKPYARHQNKGGRLSIKDIWTLFGRNNVKQTLNESTSQSPQIQDNSFQSNQENIKLMEKKPSQIKDINDVLALIKKGVKVQFDITKPTDRNLDWIQIKVPNKNNGDGDSPM